MAISNKTSFTISKRIAHNMHILSLVDDNLIVIFRIVEHLQTKNVSRGAWGYLRRIYGYFSISRTCKKFLEIGRRAFDHSAYRNKPLRNACKNG
jgi:hypothetical protein